MSTDLALPSDNAPARVPPATAEQMAKALLPEVAKAAPDGLKPERIVRLALTCIRKDPQLARSTPESFAGALLTASAMGLEPGVNDEAYLVAYEDKKNRRVDAQLIVGYQGFAKLFYQHPLAKHLDAQAVHENDEFDYAYGLDPYLKHRPAKGDRGKIVYYYAAGSLTTGAKSFVVLTPEEVKALRQGRVGPSGRIPDPMHWMERKTALRQLFKLLPRTSTLSAAIRVDEASGHDLQAELVAERRVELPVGSGPVVEQVPYDAETGEILPTEEPPEVEWPEVAQPGGRR